jgi:hypothetical protein
MVIFSPEQKVRPPVEPAARTAVNQGPAPVAGIMVAGVMAQAPPAARKEHEMTACPPGSPAVVKAAPAPARRFLGLKLPGGRVGRILGGGAAAFIIANEIRGLMVVAAIGGEMWRQMLGG